ncbi:MAG: hypothetical protein DHS20C11_12740 [Lysobacteraceae bacterium]|nr:MAG: hypothetical protein DHS20C11_12740 [Xanthomonadaceae bacterium]
MNDPTLKCPECGRTIANRRHRNCVACGRLLPKHLLDGGARTDDDAPRVSRRRPKPVTGRRNADPSWGWRDGWGDGWVDEDD